MNVVMRGRICGDHVFMQILIICIGICTYSSHSQRMILANVLYYHNNSYMGYDKFASFRSRIAAVMKLVESAPMSFKLHNNEDDDGISNV